MEAIERRLFPSKQGDVGRSTSSPGCGQTRQKAPFERMLRFSQQIRARIKHRLVEEDIVSVDAPSASLASDEGSSAAYNYGCPQTRDVSAPYLQVLESISATTAFRRLSNIRFLGSLDYAFVYRTTETRQRYNRAQHSRGVALLAANYCHWQELEFGAASVCVAAAMLHDIGHGPFSHTLEPLFKERFGVDHHSNTEDIILGRGAHSDEIPQILKQNNIDPDHIVSILSGDDLEFDSFFSSPINFDTVEGILRSRAYIAMPTTRLDPLRIVQAATFREGALHRDLVDSFWNLKDEMYSVFIRSPAGVLCDYIFLDTVRNIPNLSPEDFYGTEEQIFRKAPLLKEMLGRGFSVSKLLSHLPSSLEYEERHFFVSEDGDFFAKRDRERYLQTRRRRTLQLS